MPSKDVSSLSTLKEIIVLYNLFSVERLDTSVRWYDD